MDKVMTSSSIRFNNEKSIWRLPTLETQLAAWISHVDGGLVSRNLVLKRAGFRAYVRRSHRPLGGIEVVTLDIASITIPEAARGRGWFRQFRQIAEALNPWDATYYEAVSNPRLKAYFQKEGLLCVNENSYYAMRQAHAAIGC